MARLLVLYKAPKDTTAFDKYYFETHVPIAKKIPGLRKYEVSQGPVATPAGASDVHLIAILHFDDLAAIQNAFASPDISHKISASGRRISESCCARTTFARFQDRPDADRV